MTVLRALLGAFDTFLHAATSTLLVLLSVVLTSVVVLAVVGFFGVSLTGLVSLRLRRRVNRRRE